ncbi:tetratricopeptide repeat protein [Phormidium sp. CCY1219]|uniref:tetratricopeptide repeat protein n=1 Tax=Phormidium sp. CCY1219 TaxID=2886104 RepID=UPI002D1E6B35|nr:hypothetical protein [Phormidium sp. CCY1219]MEB3826348.1 hypothetical protein [Phormidium sp. CCY1219]
MNKIHAQKKSEAISHNLASNPQRNRNFFRIFSGLLLTFCLGYGNPVLSRGGNSDPPPLPPNPLEAIAPDPLLPKPPKKNEELTAEQLRELDTALDELNGEASAELAAGNTREAFEIWYRELRLRRYFGPETEVEALTRVGAIAWEREQITPVQFIEGRMAAIYQANCTGEQTCELSLLERLGQGFQVLRSRDFAIQVYRQILTHARDRQDIPAQEAALTLIGGLYLEKLDYANAAAPYEQLLNIATSRGNVPQQIAYIEDLAFIYTQANRLEKAIAMRQRLVRYYSTPESGQKIPELKLAIATDYETLGYLQSAINTYQETYTLAWAQQQFYIARDALQALARIYKNAEQIDAALEVYEALLLVDRRAYNLYGIMNTYDEIGQLHLEQNNYANAERAFKNALEIARQLNYQEAYFTEKIQQLSNPRNRINY